MMRICVIGAGAAGICAGRRLLEDAETNGTSGLLEVRIFEQTDKIGGTWVLDEDEDEEEKEGIEKCQRKDHHSSMYHNLRANIPTVMMEYDDFPFPPLRDDQTSYLEHQEVLEYLLEFANPIQHLIQFNTRVLRVRKLANANCDKWEVVWEQKTMPSSSSSSTITKTATEQFDVIFVCTGHYSVPRFPPFIHKLEMPFIHSHDYKRAEHFGGKTVAVVGAGLSGSDIVKQLTKHAKKVYFLHMPAPSKTIMENGTMMDSTNGTMLLALPGYPYFFPSTERPPNCEEKCRVVDARESTLVLADGSELGAKDGLDFVVFCTGYKYSIPFLEAEGIVQCPEDGSFVSPIWAKFIHVHHPRSLFILGLPFPILPFILFDCQMRLAIALIYGRVNPPELGVMLAEERQRLEELKEQGKPAKYFHKLYLGAGCYCPFEYFDWLNQMAKQPKHRLPVHLAIYSHFRNAQKSTAEYRTVRYVVKDEEEFEVVQVPTK